MVRADLLCLGVIVDPINGRLVEDVWADVDVAMTQRFR